MRKQFQWQMLKIARVRLLNGKTNEIQRKKEKENTHKHTHLE